MNKIMFSLLSLSTLAFVSAAPLNANAIPVYLERAPLYARFDYDDYRGPRYNYGRSYYVICRGRHHRWHEMGHFRRRDRARQVEYDYESQGYHCYITSDRW